jgi:hypothetical protein
MAASSILRYPNLLSAKAGRADAVPIQTDAIGRRVFRVDQEPANAGDYKPSPQGGMPQARGPETYTEPVQQAAQMGGFSPEQALKAVQRIRQVPNASSGLFGLNRNDYLRLLPETGGRRPSSPVLQALAGLRNLRAQGQL